MEKSPKKHQKNTKIQILHFSPETGFYVPHFFLFGPITQIFVFSLFSIFYAKKLNLEVEVDMQKKSTKNFQKSTDARPARAESFCVK
jgi:hypothetical protein